jgi:tRNA modification GTPase
MVLLVIDAASDVGAQRHLRREVAQGTPCIEVRNKIDLTGEAPAADPERLQVRLSVATGAGLEALVGLVRQVAGLREAEGAQGAFSARARHLDALRRAQERLRDGRNQLTELGSAETLAEELRLAQKALGEITGEFLPDDLLGAIFASFCIGK